MSALTPTAARLNGTVDANGSAVTDCHFTITPAPASEANAACAPAPGSGNGPDPVAATVSGLTPGTTYTVTLTASSGQGTSTGAIVAFTTPSATTTTTTSPGGTSSRRLRISKVSETANRWRAGPHKATIARKQAPIGTTFTLTLNRAAALRLTFARREPGRRSGRRCVAPASARHGTRCARWVHAGTLALHGHAGTDKIHFEGRLARGRLRAGIYRLTIGARGRQAGHRPPGDVHHRARVTTEPSATGPNRSGRTSRC